MKMPLEEG